MPEVINIPMLIGGALEEVMAEIAIDGSWRDRRKAEWLLTKLEACIAKNDGLAQLREPFTLEGIVSGTRRHSGYLTPGWQKEWNVIIAQGDKRERQNTNRYRICRYRGGCGRASIASASSKRRSNRALPFQLANMPRTLDGFGDGIHDMAGVAKIQDAKLLLGELAEVRQMAEIIMGRPWATRRSENLTRCCGSSGGVLQTCVCEGS